jgi:hypothetical protein
LQLGLGNFTAFIATLQTHEMGVQALVFGGLEERQQGLPVVSGLAHGLALCRSAERRPGRCHKDNDKGGAHAAPRFGRNRHDHPSSHSALVRSARRADWFARLQA